MTAKVIISIFSLLQSYYNLTTKADLTQMFYNRLSYRYLYIVVSAAIFSLTCNIQKSKLDIALTKAAANRIELDKVISYFSHDPDTLKFKAAIFLIENMPSHQTFETNNNFEQCFEDIGKIPPKTNGRRELFDSILNVHTNSLKNRLAWSKLETIEKIKADFLIDNINLAFKAWRSVPEPARANFDEFCNFILPFYSTEEPICDSFRHHFFEKYSWVYDSLRAGVPFKYIADSIVKDVGFINMTSIGKYYYAPLSMAQIEKSRLGLCDDGVNYLVNLFRSLGIVCAKDMIVQWGNHPFSGHSWVYLKYGNVEYPTDIGGDGIDLRTKYKGESIPKVYRYSFCQLPGSNRVYDDEPFLIDVTSFYTPTITLKYLVPDKGKKLSLNIFNSNSSWRSICNGIRVSQDSVVFENIGVNCVYIAGTWLDNEFKADSTPFYIDTNKMVTFFTPSKINYDSIKVIRKTGWCTARNSTKTLWLDQLTNCYFEASNWKDFKKSDTLYKIVPFFSTQIQTINIRLKGKYKFFRFNSNNKESYLAYLAFIDHDNNPINGNIFFKNLNKTFLVKNMFDDDPITFSGGKNYFVGYEFPTPERVSKIKFQPRNDDNSVSSNNEYCLYCWLDNNWTPIETKIAKDTLIYFHQVPKNCLMYIKNTNKGRESSVFSMSVDGLNQIWYGFKL